MLTSSSRYMFLLLGEIPWPLASLGLIGISVTTTKYIVDMKQAGGSKTEPQNYLEANGNPTERSALIVLVNIKPTGMMRLELVCQPQCTRRGCALSLDSEEASRLLALCDVLYIAMFDVMVFRSWQYVGVEVEVALAEGPQARATPLGGRRHSAPQHIVERKPLLGF
jgi:hypothetical protein